MSAFLSRRLPFRPEWGPLLLGPILAIVPAFKWFIIDPFRTRKLPWPIRFVRRTWRFCTQVNDLFIVRYDPSLDCRMDLKGFLENVVGSVGIYESNSASTCAVVSYFTFLLMRDR